MRTRVLAAPMLAALLWGSAAAAGDAIADAAVKFVQKFADAGNGTDPAAYAAFCDPDIVIIDHVPPYVFRGPKACLEEWDAVAAWIAKHKMTVTDYGKLQPPTFVERDGDRVYAVFPATAPLVRGGRQEVEKGWWTFVVRRKGDNWRILAFSWSTEGFVAADAAAPK